MARPTWCGTHSVVISTASMSALARDTVSSTFCLRRIILHIHSPRAGAVTRSSSATSTVMARPTWCGTHPVISRPRHRSMLALARATVSSSFDFARTISGARQAGAVTRQPSSATSTVMARPTWCGTHSVVISTASMLALARATTNLIQPSRFSRRRIIRCAAAGRLPALHRRRQR